MAKNVKAKVSKVKPVAAPKGRAGVKDNAIAIAEAPPVNIRMPNMAVLARTTEVIVKEAQKFASITTDTGYSQAADLLKRCKGARSGVKEEYKPIFADIATLKTFVTEDMSKYDGPLAEVEENLKASRVSYEEASRAERARVQREADEKAAAARRKEIEAAERAGKANKAAELKRAPIISTPDLPPPPPATQGVFTKYIWGDNYVIEDEAALPRWCLSIDVQAIRAHIKDHKEATSIPGIKLLPPIASVSSRAE